MRPPIQAKPGGACHRPVVRHGVTLSLLALACLLTQASVQEGVLRTRFTTVRLNDLPVGYATRLRLGDGSRYSIENTGNHEVRLRFSVQKPSWVEPVKGGPGYRPIPDASWVTLDPSEAVVPAGGRAEVEVTVRVPPDAAFAEKRYEFWLRAGTAGDDAGLALLTRVRFNTLAEPTEEQRARLAAETPPSESKPSESKPEEKDTP